MSGQLKYYTAIFLMGIAFNQLGAQTTTKATKTTTAKKAAPTVEGKAITVTLKNLAEANISIFAGKKEDIKTALLKNFGGISSNPVYVRENDVVCIMKDKKPVSCADVKPGTTMLEVNGSGNVITKK